MALQNRRAIFFPREENPPALSRAQRSQRGHVIGRKRQKYAPIGRPAGRLAFMVAHGMPVGFYG